MIFSVLPLLDEAADESFDGPSERCASEAGDSEAGDGARVPCGVFGTAISPLAIPKKLPPAMMDGPCSASSAYEGPDGVRKSIALRTESGTRCRLIDSFGGGGAGKGEGIGIAIAADNEDRGAREDGERGT